MKKLLKTKSFLIGFIMIMVSIIPISTVKALNIGEFKDGTIINEKWIYDNIYVANDISIEKFPNIYLSYDSRDKGILLYLYKENDPRISTVHDNGDGTFSSDAVRAYYYPFYQLSYSSDGTLFTKNYYDNMSNYNFGGKHINTSTIQYYSNFDIVDSTTNEILMKSSIGKISNTQIEITYDDACDENGVDIAVVRVDFGSYTEGTVYQIKIGNDIWIDVSDEIALAAESGHYFYQFNQYYNAKIEAQILENNVEIDSNYITISGLHDFSPDISTSTSCDELGRDIYVVKYDLRYCWSDNFRFQYSYDKQTYYDMDVSSDNKLFTLEHGIGIPIYFRISDINGNEIYDDVTVFSETVKQKIIKTERVNRVNGDKVIEVTFDFSNYKQFSDKYNIKYYVKTMYRDGSENVLELDGNTENYILQLDATSFENFSNITVDVYIDNYKIETSSYDNDRLFAFDDEYTNIQENELNNGFVDISYETIEGMVELIKKFLYAIEDFILAFFRLVDVFLNELNVYIRTCILSLFIELIICRIVKAVRS